MSRLAGTSHTPTTYEIGAVCQNCGEGSRIGSVRITIPKGITVARALAERACPKCGCRTLGKQEAMRFR
jgi:ssDNA-binding Zn-finger/Zn-ribbon topoisomerase 1